MTVLIDVIIDSEAWSACADLSELTERVVAQSLATSGARLAPNAELCVTFCDDEQIRALNAEWRRKDKATNVLSFPTPGALARKSLLGDIVIAYETVAREAEEQGKTLPDYVAYMIAHGFLHLIGYDHETAADAEVMEALERRIAEALFIGDPYEGTHPIEDDADIDAPKEVHVDET